MPYWKPQNEAKSKGYVEKLFQKHKEVILQQEHGAEPDDPLVDFWTLIGTGTELKKQWAANERYYASGRCGGCETCGDPPYDVPDGCGVVYVERLKATLEAMGEGRIERVNWARRFWLRFVHALKRMSHL